LCGLWHRLRDAGEDDRAEAVRRELLGPPHPDWAPTTKIVPVETHVAAKPE
jgi:hypothetical protein